jgi:uroporphyrinogen-III synthase
VRAVLTREKGSNDTLRSWLPDGALVSEVPLTTTRYFDPDSVEKTLRANEHFGTFTALVVSSARSARYVSLARSALREGGRVLAVGDATAKALVLEHIAVDVVGEGDSLNLASSISEGPALLLGAASPRDELRMVLEAKGIEVTTLACYDTMPAVLRASEDQILRDGDVIFIGAPSAWLVARGLVRTDAVVVVPGATTAEIVRQSHERVLEGWGPDLRERLAAL